MIGEHFRSLLSDISNLASVDNHSIWRNKESKGLSNLLQQRLQELQNPPDCDKARKLVCKLNKVCCIQSYYFVDYFIDETYH